MKGPSDATIAKAEAVFNQARGRILTGQGLSRKELRQLERAGLVEGQLMQNKDNGSIVHAWQPVQVSKGIIKKA